MKILAYHKIYYQKTKHFEFFFLAILLVSFSVRHLKMTSTTNYNYISILYEYISEYFSLNLECLQFYKYSCYPARTVSLLPGKLMSTPTPQSYPVRLQSSNMAQRGKIYSWLNFKSLVVLESPKFTFLPVSRLMNTLH